MKRRRVSLMNASVKEFEPLEWGELTFPDKVAIKRRSERSFLDFTQIWFEIMQGDHLLINWHHRLMADTIDNLIAGELEPKNLIVNIPPGGTKTEFFSVHFPAYQAVKAQTKSINRFRNLNISFADTLVKRNARRTRDIVKSAEFQELWPCFFGADQAEEWEIVNKKGKSIGETVSRASGGQITGGRGGCYGGEYSGCVMMDDYNKPDDMFSETKRIKANRVLVNTIRSRRGDKSKEHPTPFVSIQQRLHVDDATGFMLAGGMGVDFYHLVIPALISKEYIDSLDEPYRTLCWETVKDTDSVIRGGVEYWSYWPEMEDVHDLVALWDRDEYTFLSQYMQKPKRLSGGLIDTDWFPRYEALPVLVWRAVYVDTNSGKVEDHNDWTVFTLAGVCRQGNVYIIDVERGKWDPEDLLQTAIKVWDRWKPTNPKQPARLRYMAIEDKQAGQGLITTLKRRKKIPIKEISRGPGQNKLVRCNNVTPQVKIGQVLVPKLFRDNGKNITHTLYADGAIAGNTLWVTTALKEAADFSADDSHDNDDIWDTWMDAIDDMIISSPGSIGDML